MGVLCGIEPLYSSIPQITPLCLLTLASIVFASSFLQNAVYSRIAMILLVCAAGCVGCQADWVGAHGAWGIKLQVGVLEQVWCILTATLTFIYSYTRPQVRSWSAAVLLASTGVACASDLFQAYVWLEVMTFAFLGFVSGKQAMETYWKVHILTAIVVLIGTVSVYQDTGTLTLPSTGARQSSLGILYCGWLVKSGIGLWLLCGYNSIADDDVWFVGSLLSKVGVLGALRVGALGGELWLLLFCTLSIVCGGIVALYHAVDTSKQGTARFTGAHLLLQSGVTLLVASLLQSRPSVLAMYMVFRVLGDALLLECVRMGGAGIVAWCGVLFSVGLPPSAEFFVKLQALQTCTSTFSQVLLLGASIVVAAYLVRRVMEQAGCASTGAIVLALLNVAYTLVVMVGGC